MQESRAGHTSRSRLRMEGGVMTMLLPDTKKRRKRVFLALWYELSLFAVSNRGQNYRGDEERRPRGFGVALLWCWISLFSPSSGLLSGGWLYNKVDIGRYSMGVLIRGTHEFRGFVRLCEGSALMGRRFGYGSSLVVQSVHRRSVIASFSLRLSLTHRSLAL